MKMKGLKICLCAVLLALLTTVSAGAETFWDSFEWETAAQAEAFFVVPTVPLPIQGDLDGSGDLDPADARLALRYVIGLEPTLEAQNALWLVDRDRDGKATPADARLILRDAVGLTDFRLPDVNDDVYRIRTSGLPSDECGELGALKALEVNAGKVTDIFGDHLPLWRIDSGEALAQWLDAFEKTDKRMEVSYDSLGGLPDADGKALHDDKQPQTVLTDPNVPALLKRYGDAFFAENDLFICYKYESSGGYAQAVYTPSVKDGELTLTVSSASYKDRLMTCDIANWLIFVPVSKELTKIGNGCHTFDCLVGDDVTLHDNAEILTEASFGNWLQAYSRILTEDAEATILKGASCFTFSLENCADGGYLWVCDADEGLTVWERFCVLPEPHKAGIPCLQVYDVTGDKPGTYTLRFSLKRSWEKESIAERTVTVTVK